MNLIKCEKLEKSMVELQFSIDAETYKNEVLKVFQTEGKKYTVQGFRKGKAPRHLIERMYGSDVFTYDAINNLFPTEFEAAVKAAGIEAVGRPEVTVDSASDDQGATLTGTAANSKIVVDASHSLKAKDQILLTDENKVAGADQGTLAIYKDTLKSYLKADKIGSATTADNAGMVQLTSGGVLEFRDTSNIDLATEFNFNHQAAAGAIRMSAHAFGRRPTDRRPLLHPVYRDLHHSGREADRRLRLRRPRLRQEGHGRRADVRFGQQLRQEICPLRALPARR